VLFVKQQRFSVLFDWIFRRVAEGNREFLLSSSSFI